jgi:hypothetical protein
MDTQARPIHDTSEAIIEVCHEATAVLKDVRGLLERIEKHFASQNVAYTVPTVPPPLASFSEHVDYE